jgi:murein DD-endopeptidase MepM/ murein hydrolase activator NlpD
MINKNQSSGKSLLERLKHRYRISVLHDEHFGERFSFKVSLANLLIMGGGFFIFLVASTIMLIAFTGLRHYIPGYSNVKTQRQLFSLIRQNDSLSAQIKYHDQWLMNMQNVLSTPLVPDSLPDKPENISLSVRPANRKSREDSLLRTIVEEEDRFAIQPIPAIKYPGIPLLFQPIRGVVTDSFNRKKGHYGVDVAAQANEAVLSVLEGTVILAGWTAETGHSIVVQHAGNLVTVYKHNATLLKKEGAFVRAGEPLAIVGSSGLYTSGPHLHFEIWYNGSPLDPLAFILF